MDIFNEKTYRSFAIRNWESVRNAQLQQREQCYSKDGTGIKRGCRFAEKNSGRGGNIAMSQEET